VLSSLAARERLDLGQSVYVGLDPAHPYNPSL
jgi:hypothetical protein